MERFRICLLGSFQALLAGRPLTGFESNKTRALLAYLATENSRPHSRELLAELLWPDRPQGVALANLRHTLADLRTTIGDHDAAQPCLLVAHQTLQFDPASLSTGDAFVDVSRFGVLLTAGRGASLAACEEAAALYGGPFLQGFTLDGSPEFEAWLVLRRERCEHLAAQAFALLMRSDVDRSDYAQGAQWSQRLLELDPWNEDVHRQRMWLLAACGERAAALRQYEACVRMLAAEFAVEPRSATHILADRIHTGEDDLGAFPVAESSPDRSSDEQGLPGAGGSGPSDAGRGVHNLPVAATPLVGRRRELAEIAQTLAAPGCRLLTITGPGGSGKTRLAVETAQREAPCFRDGAWFVDLAPADGAAVLPTVLLKRLDVPGSGPADARERLIAYLAPKRMLLVLDNFEHLLDGADLVADMLAAAPALQILVTSRSRLNLSEEWLYPLDGMELPPVVDAVPLELRTKLTEERTQLESGTEAEADLPAEPPVDLGAYDATRLFLACVRRLQPGFAPSLAEAQVIVEICRHVEGMPLAIELAASSIRSLPLRALALEVENGLQRLATSLRNVPPRHRSMAAVFDQSWRLLTERERAILRGLSVFRGGATPESAGAVTGAEPADLSRLVDASWLRLGRDGRYAVHELVRQYCAARLAEQPSGEAETVRQRHCAWFGKFLSLEAQHMNYRQDVVEKLLAELGNLQAAWQWGICHGQMDMARNTALGLFFVTDLLGWMHFAIQMYAPVMATLENIIAAPGTPPAERNAARGVLGWLEYAKGCQSLDLGLVAQARVSAQRCYSTALGMEPCDTREQLLEFSDWLVTNLLIGSGEFDTGRQRTAAFIRTIEGMATDFELYGNELGRKFWLAHGYATLARCDWCQANYREAETLWQRAIALREEMGERRFCALNLHEYARCCIAWGRTAEAVDLARRGLALSQALSDRMGIGVGQLTLGMAMAAQGQWSVAVTYLQQGLAVGRQSGSRFLHVYAAVHLGRVYLERGDVAVAQAYFEEALDAIVRAGGLPYIHLSTVLNCLGMAARARGDWDLAAQYYQHALQQAPVSPAWVAQDSWCGMAEVWMACGDQVQAIALFERVAHDRATAAATRGVAEHFLEAGRLRDIPGPG